MKKIIASAVFSALAFASTGSIAAPQALVSNASIPAADCDILAEDVRIALSNSVLGAWNCVDAQNSILMATCHTSGRKASRTIDVPCDADPATPAPLCDGSGGAGATFNRVTNSGVAIFVGSTGGGQLGPAPLDGSECNAGDLAAKVPDPAGP